MTKENESDIETTENFKKEFPNLLNKLKKHMESDSEVIYYVYHDIDGVIYGMSPHKNENSMFITLPYSSVKKFIVGTDSVSRYMVDDNQIKIKPTLDKKKATTSPYPCEVKSFEATHDIKMILKKDSIVIEPTSDDLDKINKIIANNKKKNQTNGTFNFKGTSTFTFAVVNRNMPHVVHESHLFTVNDLCDKNNIVIESEYDWNNQVIYSKNHSQIGVEIK